jgi:hypothetical protein
MSVQKISQCCEEKLQNKGSNNDEQPINGYEEKNESKDIPNDGKLSPLRFINEIVTNSKYDARIYNWRNGKNKNLFHGDVYCPITVRITDDNMVSTTNTYFYKFYEISVTIDYIYTIGVKQYTDKSVKNEHKSKYDEKVAELAEIYNIKYSDSVTDNEAIILEEIFNTPFESISGAKTKSLFEVIVDTLKGNFSRSNYSYSTASFRAMDMSNIFLYKTLIKLDKELKKEKHNKYRVYGITCKDNSSDVSKNSFNEIFGEGNICLVLKFDNKRIYFSSTGEYRYNGSATAVTYYKDVRIIRKQKTLLTN